MGFEKYIPKRSGRAGRHSPISDLKVGECWFLPEPYSTKLYNRIYQHQRKYGKVFEYMEIKNGTIIKRVALSVNKNG